MPISEEDALGALALAEANRNNPAVVLKAKDIAVAYKAQQKAAGLPMFPNQERAREEQYSKIKGFYTDPNHGLDEETLGFVNETLRGSEDSKYKIFNKKYFEFHGIPKDQVDSQADQLINAYGLQEFKKPISSHKEFFDSISADFKAEKQVEDMAREFTLAKMGPLDSEAQFRERMESVPGYTGREAKWRDQFLKNKEFLDGKRDQYSNDIWLLSQGLERKNFAELVSPVARFSKFGGATEPTEAAFRRRQEMLESPSNAELAELVMGVPAEDRPFVIAAAVADATKDPNGRKDFMLNFVDQFERGFDKYVEGFPLLEKKNRAIRVKRLITSGFPLSEGDAATPESLFAAAEDSLRVGTTITSWTRTAQQDAVSEETKAGALKLADRLIEAADLTTAIRNAAEQDVDPITSEFAAVRGMYALSGSAPYMVAAAIPGGILLNTGAYAELGYQMVRSRSPEMSAEQAMGIGLIAAPFMAYVERLQFRTATGQLTNLNRFYNQVIATKGGVAPRFLGRTAATVGLEMVQENIQDVTPFVVQGIISAVSEDMPNVPVELLYKDMLAQQPELFFAVLPLAVMGGGAGTYSDFRNGRELLSSYDELRAHGLSEAASADIRALANKGDYDGAQSLLREEFKTLGQDQKSVQEARVEAFPKLLASYKAQSEALQSGIELDILPAILQQRDGKVALRYNDGKEVQYDSHAEAMQRFEAIASSAVLALHRDSITAARMATSQMERGREVKLIISPLDPTTTELAEQGVASAEQLEKRKEIEEADKGITPKAEEARARALTGMSANSSEARKAASYVLGSSVNAPAAPDSFGDRVIRTTARVYKRGNPYTVIEEISEGDIKFMITEGIVERPWVISALRQWESQMGDALFRKSITDDSQIENQDIVEAYSKMVVSYFAGRATAGDQGRIFSKEFRSEIAKALRMDMNAVLTGYASLFEAVYRRAAMIEKARKEGTLPADLESFLAKSAGMSPQKVFEREVVKEGEGIAEEMGVEFVDEETLSTMSGQPKRIEDFSDPDLFYRVVVGDSAFDDIVRSGVVRSVTPQEEKAPGKISLGARPTAFPSFAKGRAAVQYAKENPNHYIVVSGSNLIKASTLGRHGRGSTHFPTNAEGKYVNSLDGSEVSVYKHNGNGEYSLVYDKGSPVTGQTFSVLSNEIPINRMRRLMQQIDAMYSTGRIEGVENLEAELEILLDKADSDLEGMDENDDADQVGEMLSSNISELDSANPSPEEELINQWYRWTGKGAAYDGEELRQTYPTFGEFVRAATGDNAYVVQPGVTDEQIEEAAKESVANYERRRTAMLRRRVDKVTFSTVTPAVDPRYRDINLFREYWNSKGVRNMTDISYAGTQYEHIRPKEIEVPKQERGKGLGTAFMQDLVRFADLNGLQVRLNPSAELGATSRNRLDKFYKRFGFVENKPGKNKDYTISERFYRNPVPQAASTFSTITPAVDAEYLALAADPVKNQARLQEMADEAARAGMPESRVRKSAAEESWMPYQHDPANPLIRLFHGGKKGITSFAETTQRDSAYGSGNLNSQGVWLTLSRGVEGELSEFFMSSDAATYAASRPDGGQVYDLFANITNPKRMAQQDAAFTTAEDLRSQGYDGAYMIDSGFWVALNPNQIKSADPVTYDESGNVIPLSQRFNPARDEISFSFIGASAQVPQFMRDSLDAAQAMAAAGKTSEEIRAITGWFPGPYDGKMRWEIPDEGATLRIEEYRASRGEGDSPREIVGRFYADKARREFEEAQEAVAGMPMKALIERGKQLEESKQADNELLFRFYAGEENPNRVNNRIPLGYLLDHPKLFEMYPDLKAVPVSFSPADASEDMLEDGSFNPSTGVLFLSPLGFSEKNQTLSTTLHELQHWIQEKEGFAVGGNPNVTSYDEYRRTAGEIESRDVQARRSFTPEQRKAIAPYSSENIAPEDAIVLFDRQGPSRSSSTFSTITPGVEAFSILTSKSGMRIPKGVTARASEALPIWNLPKLEGKSLGKNLDNPKNREKVFSAIDGALDWLKSDPSKLATSSGWVNFLRKSGVHGDVMMPPSGIMELFQDPAGYVQKLNGGYHGNLTIQGTQSSARSGLDSTVAMRKLIGIGNAPHPWVVALHHMWGILSRMLPPIQQEGMWLRLITSSDVLNAIQSSIDGNFKLDLSQWEAIVQNARAATTGAGNVGNGATANANSFYLMLRNLNGRWSDLADAYAAPNAAEMGRRFWSLDAGAIGIKNKVQRFIGLTFGVPGVIMDRWKFVEFWLPTAIQGTGAKSANDYFAYNQTTPEDPLGIYGTYGGIDSGNPALSLAMYEGMEFALQAAIDKSPELQSALGPHANPGGLHWHGWNAIKNEAVGHSSLDFTADLIRNFGSDINAQSVYDQTLKGTYYTEGALTGTENGKVTLDHGKVSLERVRVSSGLQQRRAGILGRRTSGATSTSGSGATQGKRATGGQSETGTTLSVIRPIGDIDSRFTAMFSPFQRSPELRAKLGIAMREKTINVESELAPIIRAFYRTKAEVQREANVREGVEYDRLLRETFGADTQAKQEALPSVDRKAARSDAKRVAKQWMDGEMKKKEVAPREVLIGFLRTLDAIQRTLPVEVRGKIGGFVAMARLTTPAAMLEEIESRVERIDSELEKYLKKEAEVRRKKLFKLAKPKREAGKKPKGKAGADIHDLFDRLAEAMLWDGTKAEGWATTLEAQIASGELSPEAEAHAKIEANLVRLFSDWNDTYIDTGKKGKNGRRIVKLNSRGADAARRTAAVEAAEEVWKAGYLAEQTRIAKERERRAQIRADIIAGTGKLGDRPERAAKSQKDAGLSGQWKEWFLSLFNFEQVLGFAFGDNSKWTKWFSDQQRTAENQKLDEIQSVLDGLDALFRKLGGSRLGGEKLQWKLSQPSFETKKGGKMSELEGITAILMWRQEDGKRHMAGKRDENGKITSTWAYDQAFVDEIQSKLSAEALEVMDYLVNQYAGEYETLNPIFREINGINLPRNDKYSPLSVKSQQAPKGQTTDPVTGSTMSNGSMTPGSLRTRAQVVAEPDFRNAIEVFVGHKKQLAHWKAYAVFIRDAQGILGNREVGNAIEASSGQEAVRVILSWLDLFAQGGVRDAGAHLALTKALSGAMGRASAIQLVGRVGTLAIQATQLGAASAKMPFISYASRLSKLLTGRLSWADALNSPYIQRRLAQMPPSVQIAMEGLRAGKPNAVKHAVQRIGRLLAGTDALFTAGTFAIVYDYQLAKSLKAGVDPVTAAEVARNEAERIVDEIAQPTRQGTRSLFESTTTNPLGRVAWAFASEARKNMALVAYTGAKRPVGELSRALLYVIVFNGVLSSLIRTAWKDLRDDDEDEDEWSLQRILLSVATEPLYGFPGFGEIAQDAIFAAAGEYKPSGSILDAPKKIPTAIVRAPENFQMLLEGDLEQPLRDLETLLMAGGLFNDNIAAVSSLAHIVRDAEALIRNFTQD